MHRALPFIIFAASVATVLWMAVSHPEAQTRCEQSHSTDVCLYALR